MRIRSLDKSEWMLLKDLRLQALSQSPDSFWEKYEEANSFPDNYWKNLTNELCRPNGSRMFIAKTNTEKMGFVYAIFQDETCKLGGLWVNPNHRNKGVGRKLIQKVVNWTSNIQKKKTLKLWASIDETVSFYEALGFKPTSHTKVNTKDGRQIVEMELSEIKEKIPDGL